ncbi:HemK2/MTQ2 family protein methyltransferase [Streptomyces sp. NPDC058045]|uniref:HemK2/MTQ2 family protein methyltransferase n=1 Tax=Streptomyces sp. NPDC058045 TaxID=3346311 RepID=UPI0036E6A5C1
MTAPTVQATGPAPPVITLPGVYHPQTDTFLLARALHRENIRRGMDVLDVGTGSGALAICASRLGARVVAVDVARRAVLAARLNALRARSRVTVRHGDLFAPVRGRTFDLVVTNPPYVPAPYRPPSRHGAHRSWDAGPDGRAVVDRVCAGAPRALRPGGVLLMVHSGLCGSGDTLRRLAHQGLHAEIHDRARIPFGPVLRSRQDWLRERGLAEVTEDHEELVIIRARRP